jgi:hypothetical protein
MINAELIERLRETDEVLLLELLGITSTEIVDAFLDRIDERSKYIREQLEEEDV